MNGPDLNSDEVLLALLAEMIESEDQPPVAALQVALAASELAGADGELAALVGESTEEELLAGLRDETEAVVFRFRATNMIVEFEIGPGGHAIGVISPPRATEIELEMSSPQSPPLNTSCRSDEMGRFRIDVAIGLCRLKIGTGESAVYTSWFYC
jgi:hypothetical protein